MGEAYDKTNYGVPNYSGDAKLERLLYGLKKDGWRKLNSVPMFALKMCCFYYLQHLNYKYFILEHVLIFFS